jgi:hypothetical protein
MPKAVPRARDPEARQSILQAIDAAAAPVTATALGKLPGIGSGLRVKQLLAEDVSSARVFAWGKSAYWRLDPERVARDRLLELAARELLKPPTLKSRTCKGPPAISPKTVQLVFKKLLAEQRFLEKEDKTASLPGVIDRNHPELYLERKFAAILKAVGIERSPERIRALAAEIDSPAPKLPMAGVRETADKIFAAMNRIAFAPGTTVTFYLLRQQPELAHIPKEVFDEAALLLQQDRRALLMGHDFAAALPADQQERLVSDGFGNFYVSIYAR